MDAVYRSFYTNSSEITRYMVSEMDLRPGMRVLEPAAGHGALIDAVLDTVPNVAVDAFEINPEAVIELRSRYSDVANISVFAEDFLASTSNDLFAQPAQYDRVIGNPPYGGWQDYDRRRELKSKFPDLYVKETYGLFLYNAIRLLRPKGVLVFIVPDTFLNLHMHTALRRYILETCKVRRIAVFPSAFFPGVRFGYSKLCIVTLERCESADARVTNEIEFFGGMEQPADLTAERLERFRGPPISQKQVLQNPHHAVLVSAVGDAVDLINTAETKLGDLADVVTGFYSGDDKRHLRITLNNDGRRKGYSFAANDTIAQPEALYAREESLQGLDGPRHFVPIVKGGGCAYWKSNGWVIDWSRQAVATYKEDRKARFQNSKFYFARGIAVPMVSSARVTATLMDNSVFDQSIVGVFPHETSIVNYLLAFFNSKTCTTLLRTLNPSANNSANYLKKLPIVLPDNGRCAEIGAMVERVIEARRRGVSATQLEDEIEGRIREFYGF